MPDHRCQTGGAKCYLGPLRRRFEHLDFEEHLSYIPVQIFFLSLRFFYKRLPNLRKIDDSCIPSHCWRRPAMQIGSQSEVGLFHSSHGLAGRSYRKFRWHPANYHVCPRLSFPTQAYLQSIEFSARQTPPPRCVTVFVMSLRLLLQPSQSSSFFVYSHLLCWRRTCRLCRNDDPVQIKQHQIIRYSPHFEYNFIILVQY